MSEITEEQLKQIITHFENMNYSFKATQNYKKMIEQFDLNSSCYSNEVIELLDSIVFDTCKERFVKELPAQKSLYRARVIEVGDINNSELGIHFDGSVYHGYNEANSRECPLMVARSGRNSMPGQSYLYVADDEGTACAEIKSRLRQLISLAEFKTRKELKIIDFSKDVAFEQEHKKIYDMSLGVFFTKLMMEYSIPVVSEKEYRITQIISDHFRKTGIDGIAYRSFYSGKTNYTIFNCHPRNIEFIGSRVLAHQHMTSSFWDFSNKIAIKSQEMNVEYDDGVANKILKDLNFTIMER